MCRLAWQHSRPSSACFTTSQACFATSQACLQRPRRPRHAFLQGPKSPTSKKNPPTFCLISCEAKGVVYHRASETQWYTTPLASQLIRQQVGGFFFDVGLVGPCKNACRGRRERCKHAQDVAKYAQDVAKHAENVRGRCQACLGVAKQAYTSQVPTQIFFKIKQGYNRNISKLITFNFRNKTIFWDIPEQNR